MIVFIFIFFVRAFWRKRRYKKILLESRKLILQYAVNLGKERFAKSFTDPYGIRRFDEWQEKGIDYFYKKVFLPNHSAREQIEKSSFLKSQIYTLIDQVAVDNQFFSSDISPLKKGSDYEIFCENKLVEVGWNVIRTPATGDCGVDLVAQNNGYRVCIQCKNYSKAVGNSAVQEVVAGKAHYSGSHAVVVSNNSFTKKARELALRNNVILLHHSQLVNLLEIIVLR